MSSVTARPRQLGSERGDGIRRTRLAEERTYLAWLRSGFAAFAVSLGAGKVAPALAGGSQWPYTVLGVGFGLVGITVLLYGLVRNRVVERAISEGRFQRIDERMVVVLTMTSVLLGTALLFIMIFG